jgi:hypothetical protein
MNEVPRSEPSMGKRGHSTFSSSACPTARRPDADAKGECPLVPPGMALGRLQELLQRQLELVQQGSLAAAVDLFEETDRCVRVIAGSRAAAGPSTTPQWQRLEQLYRELSLALTSKRTEVLTALNAVRQGRKMLSVYGSRTTVFRR